MNRTLAVTPRSGPPTRRLRLPRARRLVTAWSACRRGLMAGWAAVRFALARPGHPSELDP